MNESHTNKLNEYERHNKDKECDFLRNEFLLLLFEKFEYGNVFFH